MTARTTCAARTARTASAAHTPSAAAGTVPGAVPRSPTVPHRITGITVPVTPFAHPTPRAIRARRSPR
ncbi:hypothetical protein ACWEQO_23350 [Streptomyces sp. NPDC004051]